LYTNDVPAAVINYITALRSNKVTLMHVAELLEATGKFKDATAKETELASGVGKEELPIVLDRFTTTSEKKLSGLLNVNTASAGVLQTLPGIEEGVAQAMVAARRGLAREKAQDASVDFSGEPGACGRFQNAGAIHHNTELAILIQRCRIRPAVRSLSSV
jgi:hypothetical protein